MTRTIDNGSIRIKDRITAEERRALSTLRKRCPYATRIQRVTLSK